MSSYILVNDQIQSNEWWKTLVRLCARIGDEFEICCWADEKEEIEQAMPFGHKVPSSWHGGTVIQGGITKSFVNYLTALDKPEADIYNKMTPFFTVRLGGVLSSEHYGTEVILSDVPAGIQKSVDQILAEMERSAQVHRNL